MTGIPNTSAAGARAPTPTRVAREFEDVFAGQLAKLMLEQVAVDPVFGGGHGEELFRGVLAEELGKAIGKTGDLGIAPAVLDHLQKLGALK